MEKSIVEEMAEKIRALPQPQRLRLAADLLEQDKRDIAQSIVAGVALEWRAAREAQR